MPVIDFVGFDNHPKQPRNTCGQAVIASVLHHKKRSLSPLETPSEVLDRVLAQYGPNWPIRNMVTHPSIIRRALREAGIAFIEHSLAAEPEMDPIQTMRTAIDRGSIVIVLLDIHALRMGARFTLHWAVVVGYEVEGDDITKILLSSWGRSYTLDASEFSRALRPWFLPRRFRNFLIEVE